MVKHNHTQTTGKLAFSFLHLSSWARGALSIGCRQISYFSGKGTLQQRYWTRCFCSCKLYCVLFEGNTVNLSEYDPNTVASLLKLFLREFPEPLIPPKLFPRFEAAVRKFKRYLSLSLSDHDLFSIFTIVPSSVLSLRYGLQGDAASYSKTPVGRAACLQLSPPGMAANPYGTCSSKCK